MISKKNSMLLIAAVLAALALGSMAQRAQAQMYYYVPTPVYVAPAPVVYSAPVYLAPAPVYAAPVVYGAPAYYYPSYGYRPSGFGFSFGYYGGGHGGYRGGGYGGYHRGGGYGGGHGGRYYSGHHGRGFGFSFGYGH